MGDAIHSMPYLSGEWSVQMGGEGCECRPAMPFDAILVASRMMVAKEACTAPEVKQILINTPGIPIESTFQNIEVMKNAVNCVIYTRL